MSESKHTPGPWKAVIPDYCDLRKEPYHIRGKACLIGTACLQAEETESNARLMAAAPDLLDALEAASAHLDYCGYGDEWERDGSEVLAAQIQAAIAKAEEE